MAMPGLDITYAELLGRVQSCASWLKREGCHPAEVVGITVAEETAHMVVSLALLAIGVPQICLPSYDPAPKRRLVAARLGVARVIVDDPQYALPGPAALVLPPQQHTLAVSALIEALADGPDAPAVYYASSGTTGEPKIFALSQAALAWRAERIIESERTGVEYRALTPVSVEDPFSKNRRLMCSFVGVTSVFQGDRSSAQPSLPELCQALGVTCLELSVLQVSSLVNDPSEQRHFPAQTNVYTAGAAVSAKIGSRFEARFGVPLLVHYGAREFGRIACKSPADSDRDLDTVGRAVPWVDLEIVDEDGRAVPSGEVGAIRVRSEHMTSAYYRDPVATALHFRDGWFYPRDMGSLTSTGALRLHGRADDVMNLNGIKIFPAEIERVLEEHPAVRAAAAFAKRSVAHGDIPVAAVELHASASVEADELMASTRALLGVRAPRKIIVLDALPRNAAGKVLKRDLAELLLRP
jgi:acyl-coenzyme A synthetase/AMP-(fatty) acid ligase